MLGQHGDTEGLLTGIDLQWLIGAATERRAEAG
jgi:hypothetical protein